jgi:hypothetical protein
MYLVLVVDTRGMKVDAKEIFPCSWRAHGGTDRTQGVRAPKSSNRTIPRKDTREELTKEIQPDADTRVSVIHN